MKADEKIIGEAIRRQRIKAEIPLEEVAARANLSPISVRALELGRGSTLSTMLKVLAVLDASDFITEWAAKGRETSPLQVLRASRNMPVEPKRVPKKKKGA